MDRQELNKFVIALQIALRLDDWKIRLDSTDELKYAAVDIERELRVATIRFNPALDLSDRRWQDVVAHEVVHILLADMDFVANNGRSIELMEVYNLFEERVCNTLGSVLAAYVEG